MPPKRPARRRRGRPYRFLPHTADVAVAIRARTLPRLFEHASAALFDLVTDRLSVRPRRAIAFTARGQSPDDLLVRVLTELLYLQEVRDWRFRACRVLRLDRRRLTARCRAAGERFDPARHERRREVKAVTYHDLRLVRRAGAWSVRLVFDI